LKNNINLLIVILLSIDFIFILTLSTVNYFTLKKTKTNETFFTFSLSQKITKILDIGLSPYKSEFTSFTSKALRKALQILVSNLTARSASTIRAFPLKGYTHLYLIASNLKR